MKTNFKPWLFGLIQATAVVCFSFVLYIAFSYIVRFNFSKSLDSLLLTTISALGFVFALLTYALIVMSRPVYLFVSKKPLEGIKTVAYTAVFFVSYTCGY